MDYQAPAIEQRVAVSAPLNTIAPSENLKAASPRWRTESTDTSARES